MAFENTDLDSLDTQERPLMLVVRKLKLMKVVKRRSFDEMPSNGTGGDSMMV